MCQNETWQEHRPCEDILYKKNLLRPRPKSHKEWGMLGRLMCQKYSPVSFVVCSSRINVLNKSPDMVRISHTLWGFLMSAPFLDISAVANLPVTGLILSSHSTVEALVAADGASTIPHSEVAAQDFMK